MLQNFATRKDGFKICKNNVFLYQNDRKKELFEMSDGFEPTPLRLALRRPRVRNLVKSGKKTESLQFGREDYFRFPQELRS